MKKWTLISQFFLKYETITRILELLTKQLFDVKRKNRNEKGKMNEWKEERAKVKESYNIQMRKMDLNEHENDSRAKTEEEEEEVDNLSKRNNTGFGSAGLILSVRKRTRQKIIMELRIIKWYAQSYYVIKFPFALQTIVQLNKRNNEHNELILCEMSVFPSLNGNYDEICSSSGKRLERWLINASRNLEQLTE